MSEEMECLCIGCGKYHILNMSEIALEYLEDFDRKRVKDFPCPECGCDLILIGKAEK